VISYGFAICKVPLSRDFCAAQGGGLLFDLSKRAMLTGNYSELDEAIRSKIRPYLYNNGNGQWIHCAHLACLRNRQGQCACANRKI
jgi:hypothetical protein